MTIFEELYCLMPELIDLYRYEGYNTYKNFELAQNKMLDSYEHYIYFSVSQKHHLYYLKRKLIKLLNEKILEQHNLKVSKKNLLNLETFQIICNTIEQYNLNDENFSIEIRTLPVFKLIAENNTIKNLKKVMFGSLIEKADSTKYGGGYGLKGEYLEIFDILTLFYNYSKITQEDILKFLYYYRQRLSTISSDIDPLYFLINPNRRTIKLNVSLNSNFTKYRLLNALETIVSNNLYLPNSNFAKNPNEFIRQVVQEYNMVRENVIELSFNIYTRKLKKIYNLKSL